MVKLVMLVALMGSVLLPTSASADSIRIVDTGPAGPVPIWGADWNLGWLAAEFSTTAAWRITTVEGWIAPRGIPGFGGPLRMTLLSDGSAIPATPLFSTVTNLPDAGPTGWYGQSQLSWTIRPGSYWLSFEPLEPTSFGMPGMPASPLAGGAFALLGTDCNFHERSCWPWTPANEIDVGVRISADAVAPTPEPGSLLLLGTAMAFCVARMRGGVRGCPSRPRGYQSVGR